MGVIKDLIQLRSERKTEQSSSEVSQLRADLELLRKKVETHYIDVCEKNEDLRTKLYKRVDYLERRQAKPLNQKQTFIQKVAARNGLRAEVIEEEDDDYVEEEIAQE